MIESYYTPEQLEQLRIRKEEVGDERIEQVQKEWPELIAQVRAAMESGTDPGSPEVIALARRWMGLVNEFTGGDPGIERSAKRLWTEQGDNLIAKRGPEYDFRGMSEFIGRAIAAFKSQD
jgi:MerR family transcriptional regulator, thiopeptide resistance regulator